MTHLNLVHKFTPMPQAMKIPDAKVAVDKEWKKRVRHSVPYVFSALKRVPVFARKRVLTFSTHMGPCLSLFFSLFLLVEPVLCSCTVGHITA